MSLWGVYGHPSDAWNLDFILSAEGSSLEIISRGLTESDVHLRKRRGVYWTPPVMQSLPWGFKARYKTEGFHFSLNEETESQGDEPPHWWHSSFCLFLRHTAGMSLKQPPWEILHGQAILQCFSDDMICKGQREILDSTLSVEVISNSFPFLAHTSPKCASLLTGEMGQHLPMVEEGRQAEGTHWNVREDSKQFSQIPTGCAFSWWFMNNFSRAHVWVI